MISDPFSRPNKNNEYEKLQSRIDENNALLESLEEKLEESFNELISGTSQLVDMIDVWNCIENVNVEEYYTADIDEYYGEEDREFSDNSATKQIDNLFSALIQNS